MIWTTFKTTIDEQYVMMLAKRGGTTLAKDGYKAYSAIVNKDTMALTKSIMRYAKQLARADARVNELEARMEAMTMQSQPLGLGRPTQVTTMPTVP